MRQIIEHYAGVLLVVLLIVAVIALVAFLPRIAGYHVPPDLVP